MTAALERAPARPLPPRPGRAGTPAPPRRPGVPRDRWLFAIAATIAFIVFGATATGRVIFDTKLGVDINAAEFLTRLWSLWNPLEWFGSLQDQYIGYAIPMAPFFLAGQLLHIPVWLIERAWLALLIAVGFTGMVKLGRALRIGTDSTRLVAAAMFVLWPTFTIVLGSTSAAALPGLIVPWAILPLVGAAGGRTGVAGAAARSGLAVALMGGVNAASTLAVLILPGLYILTHSRGRARLRLAGAWVAAVLAATAWWLIPLLLQGRYSFNFLPYVEQAATTSRTMSAAAVLRGTGTWTAYFDLSGTPWLAAGWAIVTSAGAMLASAAAAGAGLAGLARRDMPERRWLCASAGLAAAVALAGYYGPLGGPAHAFVDKLLNGPLAPVRSLYKVEPVIALALAFGAAHLLARCAQRRLRVRLPARLRRVVISGGAAIAPVVALVLVGLALPYLAGQGLQQGSFTAVPGYWSQATAYLAAHSPRQTALVVPADPHGEFTWGETIDDPLEPLATSPWVERALVPFGGAGSQVFLQTAEQAVESGQQVPGLAAYLERAGIRDIVVRNDTSLADLTDYTPPQVVNETLALSGFRRVAGFGPAVPVGQDYPNIPGLVPGLAASYPSVEIFAPAGAAPSGPATALPVAQTALVSGGPDSLLQLDGQGVLGDRPAVIAGQQLAGAPALVAVTDGQRRADNDFGVTKNFLSYPYTADGTNPAASPLGDPGGQPRQLLPVPPAGHQSVAVLAGARSVTASSAGTWLTESTAYDPVNAFDGNKATAWAESNPDSPVGQWIQINFTRARKLPSRASIRLLTDSPARAVADQLRVTTAAGSVTTGTIDSGAAQPLNIPPGSSGWLRITITGAQNARTGFPGAGFTDVSIPGVKVTSYLAPAPVSAGAPALSYSFSAPGPSPYQGGSAAAAARAPLNRQFTTAGSETLAASITATPLAGPALAKLIASLAPARPGTFAISASSSYDSRPALGADNLITPGASLPWIAAASDTEPRLTISWTGKRLIRQIVVKPAANGKAAAPTGAIVYTPGRHELLPVGRGGVITLSPPIRTSKLTLQLSASAANGTAAGDLPVGLSSVSVPALASLAPAVPAASSPLRLACGSGPAVTVDGKRYQSAVTGTAGDLIRQLPVQLRLCAPGAQLKLSAGQHRLTAASSADFTVTGMTLTAATAASAAAPASARQLRVVSWGSDSRQLRIGPGAESYVEVHENASPGWHATLNGKPLTAATLDGWQQAFVVPAGQGGTIRLSFAPAAIYHAGIVVSAVALLALLAVALRRRRGWPWRRRKDSGQPAGLAEASTPLRELPAPAPLPAPAGQPGGAAWTAALSAAARGPAPGSGAHRARHARSRPEPPPAQRRRLSSSRLVRVIVMLLPVAAVIALAGGPLVLVVPVLAVLAALRPGWLPAVALTAMLAAGVFAATATNPTALGSGTFSAPAQACALIALTAALLPVLRRRPA